MSLDHKLHISGTGVSHVSKKPTSRIRYVRRLADVPQLTDEQRQVLEQVVEQYAFRANDYYLSLIDWNDPDDPIRQLIIPRAEELASSGKLDASNEQAVSVQRGVQHKYQDTVLLLCSDVCGAFCRFCFQESEGRFCRQVDRGMRTERQTHRWRTDFAAARELHHKQQQRNCDRCQSTYRAQQTCRR